MNSKRALLLPLLAACSRHAWSEDVTKDAEPIAPEIVSCVTTTTCTLACDAASTFTTIDCAESVVPARCVSSSDESAAYGCALSCDHEARIVDDCSEQTAR